MPSHSNKEAGAAVGERVNERGGTGGGEAVELGTGPVEVAGMEEADEAIVGAIERAADKGCNVGRAQKAMAGELANDLHVVVGEAEGRRLRRTAEPRQSGRGRNDYGLHPQSIPLPSIN